MKFRGLYKKGHVRRHAMIEDRPQNRSAPPRLMRSTLVARGRRPNDSFVGQCLKSGLNLFWCDLDITGLTGVCENLRGYQARYG